MPLTFLKMWLKKHVLKLYRKKPNHQGDHQNVNPFWTCNSLKSPWGTWAKSGLRSVRQRACFIKETASINTVKAFKAGWTPPRVLTSHFRLCDLPHLWQQHQGRLPRAASPVPSHAHMPAPVWAAIQKRTGSPKRNTHVPSSLRALCRSLSWDSTIIHFLEIFHAQGKANQSHPDEITLDTWQMRDSKTREVVFPSCKVSRVGTSPEGFPCPRALLPSYTSLKTWSLLADGLDMLF